jgi:hypothetical protein
MGGLATSKTLNSPPLADIDSSPDNPDSLRGLLQSLQQAADGIPFEVCLCLPARLKGVPGTIIGEISVPMVFHFLFPHNPLRTA